MLTSMVSRYVYDGGAIARLCLGGGVTVDDLSAASGISLERVEAIMFGSLAPDAAELAAIADATGQSIDVFFVVT